MSTYISAGAVTVANGGTTVTGVDTYWVGKVFEGDLFTDPAQGLFARVTADAASNTALSIKAWPGTDMTAAAYEVVLQSDSIRMSERTRLLLEQLSVVQANGRGLFYRFSDSVTDADPGSGYLRLNNAAIGSAIAGYLDNLDANGATVSAILDSWDDEATAAARGQLWLRSVADPTAFHAFKVSGSVVDGTGYRKLTLTYIGGSGSFASDDELMVMFSAQGADGTNAILGVWQGAWVTATAYGVDDLVEESGSTYICLVAHTAGTFATDLAAAKWELAVAKGDTGSTGATGATGAAGATGARGINWQGDYSGATAYVLDDGVLDNGSSWRALGATTGNAPPTIPTTSNAHWQLVARQGTDGAGTGDVVGPAGATANRVAVFDGTTGKLIKDGGKTIAEMVPAGYDDLLITVSLLALQVADNTNVTLFLGETGNRVADSFDALTYVDVAGATNLDSSVAGLLKPIATGTVVSAETGTNFGDMTAGSRLGNAFDGNTSQDDNSTATKTAATLGYLGKIYTPGKKIAQAVIYGSNNSGFVASTNPSITLSLYGKNGAPANATDGAMLGTLTFTDTANESAGRTITSNDAATAYTNVWVAISIGVAAAPLIAEATFYEVSGVNNLTVQSASFTAASAPAKIKALIRLKEVDVATAGTDYTLECSRDGGTTWSTMTLTELFTSPSPTSGIRVVEAVETSVSGQPSGTAPRWRFKTLNNKNVELHDVYIYWS